MSREPTTVPTPLQTLILWALVVRDAPTPQKELRPTLKKADRDALVRARLVRESKQGQTIHVELADGGWAWARTNTAAKLPANTNSGTVVLAGLLARLGAYMAASDVSLAEIIRPEVRPATPPPIDLPGRIRAAYLAESGGAVNRRVRLAAIRTRLADVGRAELDTALLALAQAGDAGLLPFDDPAEIGPADRAAAIPVGVQARHILWLDR
jgi:hypothetical protein